MIGFTMFKDVQRGWRFFVWGREVDEATYYDKWYLSYLLDKRQELGITR